MKNYGGHFDIPQIEVKISSLQKETEKENFWSNPDDAEKIIKELTSERKKTDSIKLLKNNIEDNIEMVKLLETDYDNNIHKQIEEDTIDISKQLESLNMILLLNGKYDKSNCILEVHSGAGGTEACDWANMLYRMYLRWCENKKFKTELIDYQGGEETGIKSVSIKIIGENAYGYLKNEKGVHRLVRISPFDSNSRRHTSFASVEVSPEIEQSNEIKIDEKDLKIDVYRSSGCGGQGVNTTDSAVRITHLPTKIVVTCQNERSQIQNKEQAMKVLYSKLLMRQIEKEQQDLDNIKGDQLNIEFGSQIRSYVMCPYTLVKDHRTNTETNNVNKVLDGDIDMFIESSLRKGL